MISFPANVKFQQIWSLRTSMAGWMTLNAPLSSSPLLIPSFFFFSVWLCYKFQLLPQAAKFGAGLLCFLLSKQTRPDSVSSWGGSGRKRQRGCGGWRRQLTRRKRKRNVVFKCTQEWCEVRWELSEIIFLRILPGMGTFCLLMAS